jgi:putative endonuclease
VRRGADAESYVAAELECAGWRLLDRNIRIGGAELDLVVERAGTVRIVEVRARSGDDPTGLESITPGKQRRLVRGAEAWLQAHDGSPAEVCFLVAVVAMGLDGWSIEYVDDAFDG